LQIPVGKKRKINKHVLNNTSRISVSDQLY